MENMDMEFGYLVAESLGFVVKTYFTKALAWISAKVALLTNSNRGLWC
jgi:hypothetical protein